MTRDWINIEAQAQTALHVAASSGNALGVEALLAAGWSAECIDCHGASPVDLAILHGHANCVEALWTVTSERFREHVLDEQTLAQVAAGVLSFLNQAGLAYA